MSIPRAIVQPAQHSEVDSQLKTLRNTSRTIKTVLQLLSDESRILARVYYKGNNQHHAALFWAHTSHVVRFSRRFQSIDFQELINRLRALFWSPNDSMKGPWTQLPGVQDLRHAKRHAIQLKIFLDKFSGACLSHYRQVKRCMRTGAFIQLLVVLAAISSRLHVLVGELIFHVAELVSCCEACLRVHAFPPTRPPSGSQVDLSNPDEKGQTNPPRSTMVVTPAVPSAIAVITKRDRDESSKPDIRKRKAKRTDAIDLIFGQ